MRVSAGLPEQVSFFVAGEGMASKETKRQHKRKLQLYFMSIGKKIQKFGTKHEPACSNFKTIALNKARNREKMKPMYLHAWMLRDGPLRQVLTK